MFGKKKDKKEKKTKKFNHIFYGIVLILSVALIIITTWAKKRLNVSLEEVLFTLGTPLKDNGGDVIKDGLLRCLPAIILVLVLYIVWAILDIKKSEKIRKFGNKIIKNEKFNLRLIIQNMVSIITLISLVFSIVYFYVQFGVMDYLTLKRMYTEIYDEKYVNPDDVVISKGENGTKNLICIYLESMENMYSSKELGGNQEVNLIPNLTRYAQENISFSNSDKLGGFYGVTATTWTIASLYSTTCGVPLKSVVDESNTERDTFASGITALGDILEDNGYVQEFLCGSDGTYAGRATYFREHGNYKIFDLFSAREKGYIPEDYYVWWGFEDKYLYDIAKDELTALAQGDKPFNFTMLTVDTHYPDGYVCDLCTEEYDSDVEKVVSCADKQINEFLNWCMEQDFYEDTVIIVMGDHTRMDVQLMDGVEESERTVYNCIINSGIDKENINYNNRVFCAMDMFPTILSAMGFEIEGDRLGLGTNLFSDKTTILEEMGIEAFDQEIKKKSDYYDNNFK